MQSSTELERVESYEVSKEEEKKKKILEDQMEVEEIECKEYDSAIDIEETKPLEAVELFMKVINLDDPESKIYKLKEQSVYKIAAIFAKSGLTDRLKKLFDELNGFFQTIPKARTAKIVRNIMDITTKYSTNVDLEAEICSEIIKWCQKEKRTFLQQRMKTKMAALCFRQNKYKESLKLIARLLREVKKFDDKLLMVEIQLIESRVHLRLQNIPKSKGALTAARSTANAVYCPPLLQAQIDLQTATLCAEEKDYKTAFSYFYEAFESYNTTNKPGKAVLCLKYMLLVKIMVNKLGDVYSIVNGKSGLKYAGIDLEAMKCMADAYKKRSVEAFEEVYDKYRKQLGDDEIVKSHLEELKGNLLEQNLIRIIEPFSRVEIEHVAKLINLPLPDVNQKLSEMILDKKLDGILDQGSGHLILFENVEQDETYKTGLETVKELSHVVDRLYSKSKKLAVQ